MQTVTFTDDFEHWTPQKTTVFRKGQTVEVVDKIADAAREKGKVKDGGRSDPAPAKGGAGAAKGRS